MFIFMIGRAVPNTILTWTNDRIVSSGVSSDNVVISLTDVLICDFSTQELEGGVIHIGGNQVTFERVTFSQCGNCGDGACGGVCYLNVQSFHWINVVRMDASAVKVNLLIFSVLVRDSFLVHKLLSLRGVLSLVSASLRVSLLPNRMLSSTVRIFRHVRFQEKVPHSSIRMPPPS
jgi:hypothetical protein